MKFVPLLFAAAVMPASAETVAPLQWTVCASAQTSSSKVAARTECARLVVPRDYADASAGTLDLDVVRVISRGERGARHDGTVLLQPDEFAEGVDVSVPSLASAWLDAGADWPTVAGRLDLVGLSSRRMSDADGGDCLSASSGLSRHPTLGANAALGDFETAEGLALSIATACQNDSMHRYIGTAPRLEDMERLREALGQSRLHVLGVGQGGWVATRYAERYPEHVGRLLLDSSWDADGSVVEAMEARVAERGRTIRRAVTALVASPARYGWGTDADEIHRQLAGLPSLAYTAWVRRIVNANDLSAVLAMARVLESTPSLSTGELRAAVSATRFSADDEVDRAIRDAAGRMLDANVETEAGDPYGFGPRAAQTSPALIASAFAARCNDGSWGSDPLYWRARTHALHDAWPSAAGNETFQGMVCSEWPAAFPASSVPNLNGVSPFLMLHAEFDGEAPLRNASMMLHGHDNARMVVARGLSAHGIVGRRDRPCVSALASRFLAEGVLPEAKLTNCRLPPSATSP